MTTWKLQDAPANLLQIIEAAESSGPQILIDHEKERAVLISLAEYQRLQTPKPNFLDALLDGPVFDDFEIERQVDYGREVDLD